MGEFRFKRFTVTNERSAMKVNTDGVLLGALMTIRAEDRHLLDVGTGTGTIALMAAQRLHDLMENQSGGHGEATAQEPVIHAIDIDEPSASEAALNFSRSPWPDILSAENISLEDFERRMEQHADESAFSSGSPSAKGLIDLVFSNPPYFDSTLRSPDLRRREARHSESLSYRELLEFSSRWLCPAGRCAVVLPSETETDLCRYARMCGLFPFRIVRIRTVPTKSPRRIVVEFSRCRVPEIQEEMLTIQNEGQYTGQYTGLTSEFYIR